MDIQDNIITPDGGKWLTNGQTYSQQVWLGVRDSVENWREVDESEVPEEWLPQNEEVNPEQ